MKSIPILPRVITPRVVSPQASSPSASSSHSSPRVTMVAVNAPWLTGSSPLNIQGPAHEMPKNAMKDLPRYKHDGIRTAEEHIQAYKDALIRLQVEHEDVACRMFPMTLDDHSYDWYISLPTGSIPSWAELESAFINHFRLPIDPAVLYHQFASAHREPNEPMRLFNTRFHKLYTRLVAPYTLNEQAAVQIYLRALDPLTSMFVRRSPTVTTLTLAYAEAMTVEQQLMPQGYGVSQLPSVGQLGAYNQVPMLNQALSHNVPMMNPSPSVGYNPYPIPFTPTPLNQMAPTSNGQWTMPTFLNCQTHKPTVPPVNTQAALPFQHPTTVYNPVPTPPVQSQASTSTTEL